MKLVLRAVAISIASALYWWLVFLAVYANVLFAGYKVPHPLRPHFLLKIQTDGSITPTQALEQACTKLIGTLASLEQKFKREFSFKEVEPTDTADGYGGGGVDSGAWASGRDYLDF